MFLIPLFLAFRIELYRQRFIYTEVLACGKEDFPPQLSQEMALKIAQVQAELLYRALTSSSPVLHNCFLQAFCKSLPKKASKSIFEQQLQCTIS